MLPRTGGCVMEWPILAPAPVVTYHTEVFRAVVDNHGPFRPCPHDVTGLIVLPNQSSARLPR
jgi:hypothetical protein